MIYMKRKKYHMVKKLLAECISEDKIETIIKYYKEKFHEKIDPTIKGFATLCVVVYDENGGKK